MPQWAAKVAAAQSPSTYTVPSSLARRILSHSLSQPMHERNAARRHAAELVLQRKDDLVALGVHPIVVVAFVLLDPATNRCGESFRSGGVL